MQKSITKLLAILLIVPFFLNAFEADPHPFNYDMHLTYTAGTNSKTMVCFHGMGGDYQIAKIIKQYAGIGDNLVSFNFPDYGVSDRPFDPYKTSFGTIHELLCGLFVLKQCVVKNDISEINLYGFSAGGGIIVNTLAILNSHQYDQDLKQIGIDDHDKEKILKAIQRGRIILDAPLKSVAEIIETKGGFYELEMIGNRFRENALEPIQTLLQLHHLSLYCIVHFQEPDEILSNRDDNLYFERLSKANSNGTTILLMGRDKGHLIPHPTLWKFYRGLDQ